MNRTMDLCNNCTIRGCKWARKRIDLQTCHYHKPPRRTMMLAELALNHSESLNEVVVFFGADTNFYLPKR